MAAGRMQLQLGIADLNHAWHRQRLNLPQRERSGAFDVVLLVKFAQLTGRASGFAG